ncbi:MAG: ribosome maturation factor RimM [Alphaproteobacteria bacterium]|nr:ribosome maturation factor RimM [Alphaproteobacteria bacterium]
MGREDDWVCLGVITRPHGVRGLVRIRPFTDAAEAVAAYGPLTDPKSGRLFEVSVVNVTKGVVTARIEGVEDRDQAAALKGTELCVARASLPEPEDAEEYYHHDIIGLAAVDRDGAALGQVVGVENYGAGDLLELRMPEGKVALVPFTRDCVPVVDVKGGRVVIDPLAGLFEKEDGAGNGGEENG